MKRFLPTDPAPDEDQEHHRAMGALRTLSTAGLVLILAACSAGSPSPVADAGAGAGASSYRVSDASCPDGWSGLSVSTTDAAEVEYLDDMPACTDATGSATYLKNSSDAVWILQATDPTARGPVQWVELGLKQSSFVSAMSAEYPNKIVLVPDAALTVQLRPDQIAWLIDLPLSFGWQGHDLVVDQIAEAGQGAAIAALKRRTPAGAALLACTLAVTDLAKATDDLKDATSTDVVLKGLGVGVSTNSCARRTAAIATVDETGRSVALSKNLERLRGQGEVLERVSTKLQYAQRGATVVKLVFKNL